MDQIRVRVQSLHPITVSRIRPSTVTEHVLLTDQSLVCVKSCLLLRHTKTKTGRHPSLACKHPLPVHVWCAPLRQKKEGSSLFSKERNKLSSRRMGIDCYAGGHGISRE